MDDTLGRHSPFIDDLYPASDARRSFLDGGIPPSDSRSGSTDAKWRKPATFLVIADLTAGWPKP